MTYDDDDDRDPMVDRALSDLPRAMAPSGPYIDRVMSELRTRGLVKAEPSRARRMLIAATWFIAGVGTGAASLSALRPESPAPSAVIASSQTIPDLAPAEPVEWY